MEKQFWNPNNICRERTLRNNKYHNIMFDYTSLFPSLVGGGFGLIS